MSEILNKINTPNIQWKDLVLDMCIKDFSMKEDAKVITYEYAGRNGAEHERVLKNRVFSISGEFNSTEEDVVIGFNVEQLVKQLRLTNDNKPGVLVHPTLGSFTCIMSNLSISQSGENYYQTTSVLSGKQFLTPSYTFSFELLEHTPPSGKSINDINNLLFPKATVKELGNPYLKYKNAPELYNAIKDNKIQPGIDPNINKEWLEYPKVMRQQAYDWWKADGFTKNTTTANKVTVSSSVKKVHTVKVGETGIKIAKKYGIAYTTLVSLNRIALKKPTNLKVGTKLIISK